MRFLYELCPNDQLRAQLTADTELMASGVLDSFGVVQLIQFVEQEFDIRIPDGDIGPHIFASASALSDYVEQKRALA
jgi:acyl carrier protein